jgi:phosphate transport system permease protein
MDAHAHPFLRRPSRARTVEAAAFGLFRSATYFILVCATIIFGLIFFRGAGTVFKPTAPFINWTFLTESPETLYVFEYEGKKMEMGDKEFRAFEQTHKLGDTPRETYAHSAGGIWP